MKTADQNDQPDAGTPREHVDGYRPYTKMAQFHREIGKYVDVDELSRLELSVTLD